MKKGFTLVELLIAIVIIGVLLGIVIPKITETIDRSRETSTLGNLGNLKTAIATYFGHNEEWPRGDIAGHSDGDLDPPGRLDGNDFVAALVPDYIDKIPPCMLRRGIANNHSTMTYTNEIYPPEYLEDHRNITNDGGWWYHVGSHTLRINSLERDTVGVFYSDYE
ncbi:MAG: type II secretion system protein [bacterium]